MFNMFFGIWVVLSQQIRSDSAGKGDGDLLNNGVKAMGGSNLCPE